MNTRDADSVIVYKPIVERPRLCIKTGYLIEDEIALYAMAIIVYHLIECFLE